MGTVTISASFGARGNAIGNAVAEQLDIPFLDRAIPRAAALQLHLGDEAAEAFDERAPSRWGRIAAALAELGPSFGSSMTPSELVESPEIFRTATETVLRGVADTTGAVILGRSGMVVLADRDDVLRVRLDGPVEDRIAQAIADGSDEKSARRAQRDIDGARESYSSFFYKVHQDDPHLYHLVIDATILPTATCVDLIVEAAKARFAS